MEQPKQIPASTKRQQEAVGATKTEAPFQGIDSFDALKKELKILSVIHGEGEKEYQVDEVIQCIDEARGKLQKFFTKEERKAIMTTNEFIETLQYYLRRIPEEYGLREKVINLLKKEVDT